MKSNRIRVSYSIAATVLLASVAFAAPDGSEPAANLPASPQQALAEAKVLQGQMQDAQRVVVQLQDKASKEKDIVKLNTVNDKLTQLNGILDVAAQTIADLNVAVAKFDLSGSQQDYQKMQILYQNALVLETEAKNAVGADSSYIGDTIVQQEIDPTVPQGNFTNTNSGFPNLTTERPPSASSP